MPENEWFMGQVCIFEMEKEKFLLIFVVVENTKNVQQWCCLKLLLPLTSNIKA